MALKDIDFTSVSIALLGGGGLATIVTQWFNRRKTSADARKTLAEAHKIDAEAKQIEAALDPDKATIKSLSEALGLLQAQIAEQARRFASREDYLQNRIDAMERELVDLRRERGGFLDRIAQLENDRFPRAACATCTQE